MARRNKCSSVYIYKNLWSQASIYLLMCLTLASDIKFWALLLSNLSPCILIPPRLPLRLATVSFSWFLHLLHQHTRSRSCSLALVSAMPASWVIGPESIPLRPLRKTRRGRGGERKRGNKRQRGGREGRSQRLVESLRGRRDSRKEVLLSSSTAAQSHIQYFPH